MDFSKFDICICDWHPRDDDSFEDETMQDEDIRILAQLIAQECKNEKDPS
jgi:hypothetical protein